MADPYGPKRDRWGRYLLPHPDGGKEQPWTRVTTWSSTIADMYGLTCWKMRMVAKGIALRPDLYALAASTPINDRTTLDKVAEDAQEAAGSAAGANQGTALHAFTEAVDRGEDVVVPNQWKPDVDAYTAKMAAAGVTTFPELIERIVVIPQFTVAGTFDRIVETDGRLYIADLKTGQDLTYAWGEIAIQLALYAHGTHMWTGSTYESMPEVNLESALVIHLPVGQGRCDLWWVDIKHGWDMAFVCSTVRDWRLRRNLAYPHNHEVLSKLRASIDVTRLIADAPNEARLVELWQRHADTWTDELTALAAARKKALSNPT